MFLFNASKAEKGSHSYPHEPTESEEDIEPTEHEEEQVREILDMKISTRSAAEMKDFQALNLVNCRIIRSHRLATFLIQDESLAPTWKKVQALFLQEHAESHSHLQLEISKRCRSLADSLVVYYHDTFLQVTVRDNYDSFRSIINRQFVHFDRSEEKKAVDENPTMFLQVVLQHHQDMEYFLQLHEEVQLKEYMGRRIKFLADDENRLCIFLP